MRCHKKGVKKAKERGFKDMRRKNSNMGVNQVGQEVIEPEVVNPEPANNPDQPTALTQPEVMEQVYTLMDKKDAELIEATLKGIVAPDKLVYRFKVKVREGDQVVEREVKGLTALGIREVVHYLNKEKQAGITILPNVRVSKEVIAGEEYIVAMAIARDRHGNCWAGAAQQPVKMRVTRRDKQGNTYEVEVIDPFAVAKAVTKAQRNALRGLFPEPIVVELIDRFTSEGKVEDITLNGAQTQSEPTTPATPKVEPTPEEELRQTWRQIYRVAAQKFGDRFKDELLSILKTHYGASRLDLPLPQAKELLRRLEAGEFDAQIEDAEFDVVF
jgi:hypothetical protein